MNETKKNEEKVEFEDLPEVKIKQIMNMPIIETKIYTSKDKRYILHKTMITDIKPREYYEKVIEHAEN